MSHRKRSALAMGKSVREKVLFALTQLFVHHRILAVCYWADFFGGFHGLSLFAAVPHSFSPLVMVRCILQMYVVQATAPKRFEVQKNTQCRIHFGPWRITWPFLITKAV